MQRSWTCVLAIPIIIMELWKFHQLAGGFLWSPTKNKYNSRVTSLIRYKEHRKHSSALIIRRAGGLSPRVMPRGAFLENPKLGYSEFRTAKVKASANRKTGEKRGEEGKMWRQRRARQVKETLQRNGGKSGLHLVSRRKIQRATFFPSRNAIRDYGGNRDRYRGQRRWSLRGNQSGGWCWERAVVQEWRRRRGSFRVTRGMVVIR